MDIKFSENLNKQDIEIIQTELEVLAMVKAELVDQVRSVSENKLGEASQIKIGVAETKDEWGALYEQLNTYNALAMQKGKRPLPDPKCPYFAHIVLDEPGHRREVLIGYGSLVGSKAKIPIVDWRSAPVSELFFKVREGENFEQKLPKRVSKGKVELRRVVNIKNSNLVGILTDSKKYYLNEDSVWCGRDQGSIGVMSGGEGKAVRSIDIRFGGQKVDQPELVALLDKDQFTALNESADQSLLILGGAGSGKTTVALYRLAKLISNGVKKESTLVIVPNIGLVNLCRNILRSMGLHKVAVDTFDDWVYGLGKRTFKGIPKKLCAVTPDEVVRFKRHDQFYKVVDAFVVDKQLEFQNYLCKKYPMLSKEIKSVGWSSAEPLTAWFESCFHLISAKTPIKSKHTLGKIFNQIRKDALNLSEARIHLFSDEKYIKLLQGFDPTISDYSVEKFIKHTREQFFERYAKVDVDKETGRHMSLDGIDETEYDDSRVYNTVDVEDFPILYYLLFKLTGNISIPGKETPSKYEHVVIDEAQEMSLLEVKTLGHLLSRSGSVTIAGDAQQYTSGEESFESWEEVLSWMGVPSVSRHRLKTNYRSTIPIAKLATHVLGPLASYIPEAKKEGAPVLIDSFQGFGQGMVALSDAVAEILTKEPDASIAIVCKEEKTAQNIFSSLKHIEDANLVLDGDFDFYPGVDVTTVDQVKGLEFDYVIIPDADSHIYKDDPFSRRSLYVAVTRAVYQLWVFSTATPSPLIRDFDNEYTRR